MEWLDEIEERLKVLPAYREPDKYFLESCCPSGLEGTGIMDDYGHRIADAVLDPYFDFFVHSPVDVAKLIAAVRVAYQTLADVQSLALEYETMDDITRRYTLGQIAIRTRVPLDRLERGEFGEVDA